jgi:hypothetical protein
MLAFPPGDGRTIAAVLRQRHGRPAFRSYTRLGGIHAVFGPNVHREVGFGAPRLVIVEGQRGALFWPPPLSAHPRPGTIRKAH